MFKKKKGDLIFEIPTSLTISADDALQSPIESLIRSDKLLSMMPNVGLAFYILYLKLTQIKNDDEMARKWKSYLNVLPSEFHTPLYFSLEELKLLQPIQTFSNQIFIYHSFKSVFIL
jgi:hypothetical protein